MGQTTSKNTQNHKNKRKSISKLFHAQTGSMWFQIGSYLVPIGSYGFYSSQIGSYKLKHAHALFQDRFKDVQVSSRWFSTLYLSRRVRSARYKTKRGINLIILNVTHFTLFFSALIIVQRKGAVPNEHLCSSHLLCWSHLKDIWHINCVHHVWSLATKNTLKISRIGSFDRKYLCHFWPANLWCFLGAYSHPPELAGLGGRVASSKLNDCTHPPTTSWGGRGK